jgi:hypothetical protein
MKNSIILSFFSVLFISSYTYSQDTLRKGNKLSIGLNIGANFPQDAYSSKDSSKLPVVNGANDISGYAKIGFHFRAYFNYMFTHYLGAMASVGGNLNSMDISTLNIQTDAEYSAHGFTGIPPSFSNSGSYYIGEYLIGPYLKIPTGNKNFSIECKLLLGLVTANYPTLTYAYNYMGTIATQTESFKNGSGFGYNIGGGLKYSIDKGLIGLHLGIGYTSASITYSSYTLSYSSGGISIPPVTYISSLSMSWLGIIQCTLGGSLEL